MRLEIESLAYGGDAIARADDGRTVFVAGGCPGDTVDVEITGTHARYLNAEIVHVVEASADRVQPPCRYFGTCGGCQWQHVSYPAQLQAKARSIRDALSRIGGLDGEGAVEACVPSPKQLGYRNKIELAASYASGRLDIGFMKRGSDELVPVDECLLLPERLRRAPKALRGALRFAAGTPDLKILRIALRASTTGKDAEIAVWTSPGHFPRRIVASTLAQAVQVTGITRVLSRGEAARRQIAGVEVLSGKGAWQERLAGATLLVSSPSFFQVNTSAAEALVNAAVAALDPDGSDRVLDLYAGVGSFTLPLSVHAGETVAVESYGPAVSDLRRNLERNETYADVVGGDAARELRDLGSFDLALVDPPRSGMTPEALSALADTGARRIAYVSCDPATLARDAARLTESGYSLTSATPFDLFPQTFHVETLALFDR